MWLCGAASITVLAWDPAHFLLKIHYFSASGTNRILDVVGSVPEPKITFFFAKRQLDVEIVTSGRFF